MGNYVTLTNVSRRELDRIVRRHASPLYISVHATDPAVRRYMLGTQRADRLGEQLRVLREGGIRFHAQAVLCPGINDGVVLERTIDDLARMYPAAASLALVPVGLTGHRQGLSRSGSTSANRRGRCWRRPSGFARGCCGSWARALCFPRTSFTSWRGRICPRKTPMRTSRRSTTAWACSGFCKASLTRAIGSFPRRCARPAQGGGCAWRAANRRRRSCARCWPSGRCAARGWRCARWKTAFSAGK